MVNGELCRNCGKKLRTDEKALYKKIISRECESFLCLGCLSKELGVSEEALREKIAYFKKIGCTLFFM